mmetsp:Transcript_27190/g.54932  ORF Transcript_27190/g.54932 Transcript_27190/m.54932 type:complete len:251 (+) Transcript_27190:44-796(+)
MCHAEQWHARSGQVALPRSGLWHSQVPSAFSQLRGCLAVLSDSPSDSCRVQAEQPQQQQSGGSELARCGRCPRRRWVPSSSSACSRPSRGAPLPTAGGHDCLARRAAPTGCAYSGAQREQRPQPRGVPGGLPATLSTGVGASPCAAVAHGRELAAECQRGARGKHRRHSLGPHTRGTCISGLRARPPRHAAHLPGAWRHVGVLAAPAFHQRAGAFSRRLARGGCRRGQPGGARVEAGRHAIPRPRASLHG